LTRCRDFSKLGVAARDLNYAKDISPPGPSPLPDLQLQNQHGGENRKKISMHSLIQLKRATFVFLVVLACFGLSPASMAVSPPPDGGYPGFTMAEGTNALKNLTTGIGNTAAGWYSLFANSTANFNTGVGAGTLVFNNADQNTAIGAGALLSNTNGDRNTANGTFALFNNTTGNSNTGEGWRALFQNTTGARNTASGREALLSNTTGFENTATGSVALENNTTGNDNTATGFAALNGNTTGALNTANGTGALVNSNGDLNIALGFGAGVNLATGNNNIDIGNLGAATEANIIRIGTEVAVTDPFGVIHPAHTATYIAGISGTAVVGDTVVVDENGQLGTVASAARFKKEIRQIDNTSEAILALKPVRFQYKNDSKAMPQFGLIAEEVAKVNPDLVVRDGNGQIYSVRYEAVNVMLLNEFLKEHKKVAALEGTVATLAATVREQASQIQRVNARLGMSRPAPQVAENNQ